MIYEEQDVAFEINNISMEDLKLVTLSACNSAQGTFIPEDGVFGLQKAFLNGGVKNLVVATDEISDLHTYLFVEHFYENLIKKEMTIKEAYKESIIWLRDNFKSDTWKHFVLYGSGLEKVKFKQKANWIWYGLSAIILLLFGWFSWQKRSMLAQNCIKSSKIGEIWQKTATKK